MASPIFISRPPPGFTILSVIRGFQLTLLGSYRALLNPDLVKYGFYRKAWMALIASIIIQLLLWAPLFILRYVLYTVEFIFRVKQSGTIDTIVDFLLFLQNNVLNIGPLMISLTRYFRPDVDELFYLSLKWVDKVYKAKHPDSEREYYCALMQYKIGSGSNPALNRPPSSSLGAIVLPIFNKIRPIAASNSKTNKLSDFMVRYLERTALTLTVYFLAQIPFFGKIVLPATSFFSLNKVVGTSSALGIAAFGLVVPKRYMVIFISSFWGSRSLVRELLGPYFNRLPFSSSTRSKWYSNREGVLFGFGCGFYLLLRIPFVGVLIYGFAQASAAYLITKITDPPPLQKRDVLSWTENQAIWTAEDKKIGEIIANDGFSDASMIGSFPSSSPSSSPSPISSTTPTSRPATPLTPARPTIETEGPL